MTIFCFVHEGDSMFSFYWKAWGLTPPNSGGLPSIPNVRHTFAGVGPGGAHTAVVADKAVGGSRIEGAHSGCIANALRYTSLDALAAADYPVAIGARSAAHIDTRQTRKYILSVQIGTNADGADPGAQATAISNYCKARMATGLWDAIILATICSRTDGYLANFDTAYQQPYNAIIKGAGWAAANGVTAIADIASDSRLGATSAADNTTYFSDKVHPTAAGAAIGGPILRATIDAVMAAL